MKMHLQVKPLNAEAVQLPAHPGDDIGPAFNDELHELLHDYQWECERDGAIVIHLPHGDLRADPEDWVIRDELGAITVCSTAHCNTRYVVSPPEA